MNYQEHIEHIFYRYKCLKVLDIVNLKTLIVIHQAERNMFTVNLQELFIKTRNFHKYNTRSSTKGNFSLKLCRTKTRYMAISVRDVKMCNDLNVDFHNIKTLLSFKNNVKRHYINSYNTIIQI